MKSHHLKNLNIYIHLLFQIASSLVSGTNGKSCWCWCGMSFSYQHNHVIKYDSVTYQYKNSLKIISFFFQFNLECLTVIPCGCVLTRMYCLFNLWFGHIVFWKLPWSITMEAYFCYIWNTGLNKYYPPFPPHSSIVLSYLGMWIIHLLTANNAKGKKLMKTLLSNSY